MIAQEMDILTFNNIYISVSYKNLPETLHILAVSAWCQTFFPSIFYAIDTLTCYYRDFIDSA